MKANDFVKKFGWEIAKRTLVNADGCDFIKIHGGYEFKFDDLKHYIDAYELVSLFGDDISHAKKYLKEMLFKFREDMEFYVEDDCRSFSLLELQQAITLVEECQ